MSGWRSSALGELLADARAGFACGEDPPDGVFQFRMHNVTVEGRLELSKKRRVPRDTRNLDSYLVKPGDVLFNATNSPDLVGKTLHFAGHEEPAVFSNHFIRLRPRSNAVDGRFLARWLNVQFRRGVFQVMCRQWVNQATVSRDALLGMKVPHPPRVAEQRRIAEVLDRAEALRAKRRAALALLDTLTQSIFLDLFGDPVSNPKGWRDPKLGPTVSSLEYGPRFYNERYAPEGTRVVRITDLDDDGTLHFEDMPRLVISEVDLDRYALRPGDVIFARSGATVGKVALIATEAPPCIAGAYFIVLRFSQDVNPTYAYAVLTSTTVRTIVTTRSRQAAQQNFSGPGLRELPMPLPPIELQQLFARRVAAVEKLKAAHRASLAKLDELFASLQHRAFRGEL